MYYEKKCFYCAEAYLNQNTNAVLANSRAGLLGGSSGDDPSCAVSAKTACPGFEENKKKDMIMMMSGQPLMMIIMKKKATKSCEALGCCYKSDKSSLMPMMMMGGMGGSGGGMAGGGMMSMLMMKKMMGSSSDGPSCYKKVEPNSATITTNTGTCLPNMVNKECGQESDPTLKGSSAKSWTAVIANSQKLTHCGAVLVCNSWVITTASCLKQLESISSPPLANTEVFVYLDVTDGSDLTSASEAVIMEIIYHPLYLHSKYSADKKIGHDIVALKIQSTELQPICLPTTATLEPTFFPFTQTDLWTFGYGAAEGAATAGAIKIEKLKLIDPKTCSDTYRSVDFTGSICTDGIKPLSHITPTTLDPTLDTYQTPLNAISKVKINLLFRIFFCHSMTMYSWCI